MTIEQLAEENFALLHAVQSGIMQKMEAGISKETEPKHLRVGVNNALIETSALLTVLVNKGILTAEEYFTEVNNLLREEVKRYEQELTEHYGGKINISLA